MSVLNPIKTAQKEQIVSFGIVIIYNAIKTGNSTTSSTTRIFHNAAFQFQDYHITLHTLHFDQYWFGTILVKSSPRLRPRKSRPRPAPSWGLVHELLILIYFTGLSQNEFWRDCAVWELYLWRRIVWEMKAQPTGELGKQKMSNFWYFL